MLLLNRVKDPRILQKSLDILTIYTNIFQIENDFADCFGNPKLLGKIGTDIEENKCTWLVAKCLEKSNKDQRALIENCYGQKGKLINSIKGRNKN